MQEGVWNILWCWALSCDWTMLLGIQLWLSCVAGHSALTELCWWAFPSDWAVLIGIQVWLSSVTGYLAMTELRFNSPTEAVANFLRLPGRNPQSYTQKFVQSFDAIYIFLSSTSVFVCSCEDGGWKVLHYSGNEHAACRLNSWVPEQAACVHCQWFGKGFANF